MRISIVIFLTLFFSGCGYVQFQRVDWDNKTEKYIVDIDFSKHFQENIIYVLNVFNEKYYIEDDVLYISRTLWDDKETLWNYCNKADGDEWINRMKLLKDEM